MSGECELFTRSERNGYGRVWDGTRMEYAHRHAWAQANGPIPEDAVVHHLCGTRTCISLDHLALMPRGDHTSMHLGAEVCPRCGGARRYQTYYQGRRNGKVCRDCRNKRERHARAAT